MTAVAFSATNTMGVRVIGVQQKMAQYTLGLPTVWTAAGQAWDLSADFSSITSCSFTCDDAVSATKLAFDLIGTANSAGDGHTAATNKVVAYYDDLSASTDSGQIPVPDSTDLSARTAVRVTVYGY